MAAVHETSKEIEQLIQVLRGLLVSSGECDLDLLQQFQGYENGLVLVHQILRRFHG